MWEMINYSFVIPIYNRPEELNELLASFPVPSERNYEIIVVEDGSEIKSADVVMRHSALPITYISQENTGPGPARNAGSKIAKGKWIIFLDSDTLLSSDYFKSLEFLIENDDFDFFGGPDSNHPSFSPIQLAIGYSMTSFLSTGGIRGGKSSMEKFKPRSFNMGLRKEVFAQVGGFSSLRFGEDVDLSLRLEEMGFKGTLLEGAVVFHKRRTTFRQFFKQVFNSGMARIVLTELHPGSLKLVHLLPCLFFLYHVLLLAILGVGIYWGGVLLLVYPLLYLLVSSIENQSLNVGILSVLAVYTQLFGYGLGFLKAAQVKYLQGKSINYAFRDTFYED